MASETPPTDGSVQAVPPESATTIDTTTVNAPTRTATSDYGLGTGEDEEATESKPASAHPSSAVEKERSFCGKIHNAFAGFLFPRVTPISFSDFIILSIFAAIPTVLYIVLFTKMGFGLEVFYYLSENYEQYAYLLGLAIGTGAFLLYLFDCNYWTSSTGILFKKICFSLLAIAALVFTLFVAGSYPHGPIAVYIILTAGWMMAVKSMLYSNVAPRAYVSWLSGPLFFVGVLTLMSWVGWTLYSDENEWDEIIALAEAEESGCEPDFDQYPDCQSDDEDGGVCFNADIETNSLTFDNDCDESCTQVYAKCANTFILWVGPFLCTLGLVFLSFFATFLRTGSSPEEETTKFARIWLFLLFAMWVGASLSGAGAGVSTTLAALTFASFIAAAIFLAISFKRIEREEQLQRIKEQLVAKYGDHFDIFRGLLVVTCTPVFLLYFAVSFVIQQIRNLTFCTYARPPPNTTSLRDVVAGGWCTIEARRLIREFRSWNRTKVLTYAVYWGLAFMIMNVIVAQFTLVFLSWLIEQTSEMRLLSVTLILVGIGMTMFLLPPVPGVPIYLTLGIVIIPTGRDTFGLLGSVIYALVVSLCLKLLACTLQQKLIGGLLQNKVAVRQFCGVNSSVMRSMKLVLMQPGFSIAKVTILVGGPDWPTSVLCGIMDLDLIPILVGTLPIIFLITPTLLTGSFIYMSNLKDEDTGVPEFPWAGTMATVFTAITAFVQFGSMVVAAYYLEQTVSERKDELDSIPIDEEVKERDDKDEAIRQKFDEVTQWNAVPAFPKFILISSVTTMILSCYMVQVFASDCFEEYDLTYSIDEHLNGDWKNLVKPLGVVANVLFATSVVQIYIFRTWAMTKAQRELEGGSGIIYPTSTSGEIATDYVRQN